MGQLASLFTKPQMDNNGQSSKDAGVKIRIEDEEEEQKRKIGPGVDFENIHTYIGIIAVFVIVAVGTVLYSFKDSVTWFPPFIILAFGLVMLFITLLNTRQLRNPRRVRPHAVGAGWVWLLWIVYG